MIPPMINDRGTATPMPMPTLAPELNPPLDVADAAVAVGDELDVADVEAVLADVVNRVAALVEAEVVVAAEAEASAAASAVMLK